LFYLLLDYFLLCFCLAVLGGILTDSSVLYIRPHFPTNRPLYDLIDVSRKPPVESTMLFSLLPFTLLAISALALPPRYPSIRSLSTPVSWVTQPQSVPADTDLRLEWQGGDGYGWQVYYIPQWPEQSVYHVSSTSSLLKVQTDQQPVDIVKNTTLTETIWHTPKLDDYPAGTTL
jgi:hypothetical protein